MRTRNHLTTRTKKRNIAAAEISIYILAGLFGGYFYLGANSRCSNVNMSLNGINHLRKFTVLITVFLLLCNCEKNVTNPSKTNITTHESIALPEMGSDRQSSPEVDENLIEVVTLLKNKEYTMNDIPQLCEQIRNNDKYSYATLNYELLKEIEGVSESTITLALGCLGDMRATNDILALFSASRFSAGAEISTKKSLGNAILALSIRSYYGDSKATEEFSKILSGGYCSTETKTAVNSETCQFIKIFALNTSPLTGRDKIFKYVDSMSPKELQSFYSPLDIATYIAQKQNAMIVKKYGYKYHLRLHTRKGNNEASEALKNKSLTVDEIWDTFGEVALNQARTISLTYNLDSVTYKRANEMVCSNGLWLGNNHMKMWIERIDIVENNKFTNPYSEVIACLGNIAFNMEKAGGDPKFIINKLYSYLKDDLIKKEFKLVGADNAKIFKEDILNAIANSGSTTSENVLKEIYVSDHSHITRQLVEKTMKILENRKLKLAEKREAQNGGD